MKKTILLILCFGFSYAYGQDIYSLNNGANSSNDLIYSVGEIFVLPISESDEASSGIIGAVSRIEFFLTSINELPTSESANAYPNPTSNSVFIETKNELFNSVNVYDLSGKLIAKKSVINHKVDLSSLQAGIYLIKTDNPKIQSFEIVKN